MDGEEPIWVTLQEECQIQIVALPPRTPLDEIRACCRARWGEGRLQRDEEGLAWHPGVGRPGPEGR